MTTSGIQTIEVELKSVYGQELYYPVCPQAKAFCKLTGTKTLTRYHLDTIRSMGVELLVHTATPGVLKGGQ